MTGELDDHTKSVAMVKKDYVFEELDALNFQERCIAEVNVDKDLKESRIDKR